MVSYSIVRSSSGPGWSGTMLRRFILRLGLVFILLGGPLINYPGWYAQTKPAGHNQTYANKPASPVAAKKLIEPTRLTPESLPDSAGLPDGLYPALLQTQQAADPTYNLTPQTERAGWQATNTAHELKIAFSQQGLSLNGWKMRLAALNGQAFPSRPLPVASNNRVEYQYQTQNQHDANLTEWYVNGPLGLEQGFTLTGPGQAGGNVIKVDLAVEGTRLTQTEKGWLNIHPASGETADLQYGGLYAYDATGQQLPARLLLVPAADRQAQLIRLEVDTAAARYPIVIDPFIQQQRLVPAQPNSGDHLGSKVALSADGNTALVSAIFRPNTPGVVLVFTRTGSSWSEQQELRPDPDYGVGLFGYRLDLSDDGNTAVMSAFVSGTIYVFTRSGTTWTQQQIITSSTGYSEKFGDGLSLSGDGNTLLVGQPTVNDSQGAAYIFTRSGNTWSQQVSFTASDAASSRNYGYNVKINTNGTTAFVSAFGQPYTQGVVYILNLNSGSWSQQAKLQSGDSFYSDGFGYSIDLSEDGNSALFGAPDRNFVYFYSFNGSDWSQQQRLAPSDAERTDWFGAVVALSGDGKTALIGAPQKHNLKGAAYIFVQDAGSWSQQHEFTATDTDYGDYFASAVALSNDNSTALLGAPNNNNNTGAAYAFRYILASTTTLTSSPISPKPGDTVTFTATVSPAAATGTVSFTFDKNTTVEAPLSAGVSTYMTSTLSIGRHAVVATYNGDSNYFTSSSAQIIQPVCEAQTQVVYSPADDGFCGTLRQELLNAAANPTNKVVTINLQAGTYLLVSSGLTVPEGVSIITTASCSSDDNGMVPPIVLVGTGENSGNGLTLGPGTSVSGLGVRNFTGTQIVAPVGGSAQLKCVKAQKF